MMDIVLEGVGISLRLARKAVEIPRSLVIQVAYNIGLSINMIKIYLKYVNMCTYRCIGIVTIVFEFIS